MSTESPGFTSSFSAPLATAAKLADASVSYPPRHLVPWDRIISGSLLTSLIGLWCIIEGVQHLLLQLRSTAAASIPAAADLHRRQDRVRCTPGDKAIPVRASPSLLNICSILPACTVSSLQPQDRLSPPPAVMSSTPATISLHVATGEFVRPSRTWWSQP